MKIIKNSLQKNKFKILIAIILIFLGVFGRFFRIYFLSDLYNVEPITLIALFAGAFLKRSYAPLVPLSIVAITDMFLGNSLILIFTWSAWAIIGFFGLLLKKSKKDKFSFGFKMTGLGIFSSLFFYFWTNFGVWFLGSWYPHTWQGLILCYIMGLPFLKMNLLGNLVIIPVASFGITIILKVYNKIYKMNIVKSKIKSSIVS